MKLKKDVLYFIPLGGVGEIGGNLYLYGYNNKWIIVDCGIGFDNDETHGIDIYMPKIDFIKKYVKKPLGIVLTHVHEDHYGAIPYLWPELKCPVYCTNFAEKMLENKLTEFKLFGKVPINKAEQGSKIQLGPFNVEVINVNHSLPEGSGLIIRTDAGTVLHTGDWKISKNPILEKPFNVNALKRLNNENFLAVISDSTGTTKKGHTLNEKQVRDSFIKLFKDYTKKIVVTCFSSNIVRMETVHIAAKKAGRKVALVGMSLWKTYAAAQAAGYLRDIDFLEAQEAEYLDDREVVYLCTGSQGEKRSSMWKIADGIHRDLKLRSGDVAFFSSNQIPGNEREIMDLQGKLTRLGVEVITYFEEDIHASGHAAYDEFEEMYKTVKPKAVIPVHGELVHLSAHERLAKKMGHKVLLIENGQLISLSEDDSPKITAITKAGKIGVDGNVMVDLDDETFKNRKKLSWNGALFITAVLNKKTGKVSDLYIDSFGLFENKESKRDLDKLRDAIFTAVKAMSSKERVAESKVKEKIRVISRRYAKNNREKKPLTTVHIVKK